MVLYKDYGHRCYESPFGGKLECRMVPSLESLINLNVFRAVHSPFQPRSIARVRSSCMSGSQKPDSYSRPSISTNCFSKSSRVLEGRPGLRSSMS